MKNIIIATVWVVAASGTAAFAAPQVKLLTSNWSSTSTTDVKTVTNASGADIMVSISVASQASAGANVTCSPGGKQVHLKPSDGVACTLPDGQATTWVEDGSSTYGSEGTYSYPYSAKVTIKK